MTAEACPHHFTLTEDLVRGYNTHAKMNPLQDLDRCPGDQGRVIRTIDVIAYNSCSSAVTQEKQQDFTEAPFGIVGLETCKCHSRWIGGGRGLIAE